MQLGDLRRWLSKRAVAPPQVRLPASRLPVPRLAAAVSAPARHPAPSPGPPAAEPPGTAWPPARIALAQQLWGEGFILPGGAEEVLRLATPLGLSAASSLLLLGCGAGGPARCIAALFGAWVAGYEADPALAAEAAAVCARANLGKRVRIARWNPEAPDFPARSCHHVLGLDPFRQSAPVPVLAALARALRPGGQVTLLATVAGPGFDPAAAESAAWLRLDGGAACGPPGQEAVTQALLAHRCDVRVVEDVSAPHSLQAVQAWRGLVAGLHAAGGRPSPTRAAPLVREAEAWLRRARLLRTGQLRWVRWHAIGRAG